MGSEDALSGFLGQVEYTLSEGHFLIAVTADCRRCDNHAVKTSVRGQGVVSLRYRRHEEFATLARTWRACVLEGCRVSRIHTNQPQSEGILNPGMWWYPDWLIHPSRHAWLVRLQPFAISTQVLVVHGSSFDLWVPFQTMSGSI